MSDRRQVAVVIIARAPELGRVKTRLAATLGAARTLGVYRQLLAGVVRTARSWAGPVLLASSGDDDAWSGSGLEDLPRQPQPSGDLGRRIRAALSWGLTCAPRAIAIGTDCPALSGAHLDSVIAALDAAPIAFGPACDGGYWSIAVRDATALAVATAETLPWSHPTLLEATQAALAAADIPCAFGARLADCDDIDDLALAVTQGLLTWPEGPKVLP